MPGRVLTRAVRRCAAQIELGGDVRTSGTKAQQAANNKAALALRDPVTAAIRAMMAAAIERAGKA